MISRDYLLGMVEKFAQMVLRIRERITLRQYAGAREELDGAFQELVGEGALKVSQLSEAELLARVAQGGPTHAYGDKVRLLVALLQEAGRIHASENRETESHASWLVALNLLLTLQMQDADFEFPDIVPGIDLLRDQLGIVALPLRTQAAMWRHYERVGMFGRAEDALFALLEAEPGNAELLAEAQVFYERLLRLGDAALEAGNLAREEVAAGLENLKLHASSDRSLGQAL